MISTIVLTLGLAWQTLTPDAIQHVQAGIAAQKQGRLADAIIEFRKVTELAPNYPRPLSISAPSTCRTINTTKPSPRSSAPSN